LKSARVVYNGIYWQKFEYEYACAGGTIIIIHYI
jgi:hypothetical protein